VVKPDSYRSARVTAALGTLRSMSSPSHCARPGCSGSPVAVLTYDYRQSTAWLDDVGGRANGTTWLLCMNHADNLRVPMGWDLQDRRAEVVSLRSSRAS
jgi:hypothetical protein